MGVTKISIVILGFAFIGFSCGRTYPSIRELYFPTLRTRDFKDLVERKLNPTQTILKKWGRTIEPGHQSWTDQTWTGQPLTGQPRTDQPRTALHPPAQPRTILPYYAVISGL